MVDSELGDDERVKGQKICKHNALVSENVDALEREISKGIYETFTAAIKKGSCQRKSLQLQRPGRILIVHVLLSKL